MHPAAFGPAPSWGRCGDRFGGPPRHRWTGLAGVVLHLQPSARDFCCRVPAVTGLRAAHSVSRMVSGEGLSSPRGRLSTDCWKHGDQPGPSPLRLLRQRHHRSANVTAWYCVQVPGIEPGSSPRRQPVRGRPPFGAGRRQSPYPRPFVLHGALTLPCRGPTACGTTQLTSFPPF